MCIKTKNWPIRTTCTNQFNQTNFWVKPKQPELTKEGLDSFTLRPMARQPEASPTYTPATPMNMPTSCSVIVILTSEDALSIPHTQCPNCRHWGKNLTQTMSTHIGLPKQPYNCLTLPRRPSTNAPELGFATHQYGYAMC